MKREIIHPKGFSWSKDGEDQEKDRWEKITDPKTMKKWKELSARLKAESNQKNNS